MLIPSVKCLEIGPLKEHHLPRVISPQSFSKTTKSSRLLTLRSWWGTWSCRIIASTKSLCLAITPTTSSRVSWRRVRTHSIASLWTKRWQHQISKIRPVRSPWIKSYCQVLESWTKSMALGPFWAPTRSPQRLSQTLLYSTQRRRAY